MEGSGGGQARVLKGIVKKLGRAVEILEESWYEEEKDADGDVDVDKVQDMVE